MSFAQERMSQVSQKPVGAEIQKCHLAIQCGCNPLPEKLRESGLATVEVVPLFVSDQLSMWSKPVNTRLGGAEWKLVT